MTRKPLITRAAEAAPFHIWPVFLITEVLNITVDPNYLRLTFPTWGDGQAETNHHQPELLRPSRQQQKP